MSYCFSAIWGITEVLFVYFFLGAFLRLKRKPVQCLMAVIIAWGIGFLNACLSPAYWVKLTVTVCLFFAMGKYMFRGVWYQYLILVVLALTINGLIDTLMLYGTVRFLGISYAEFVWRKFSYVAVITISKLLSLLLAWAFRRIRIPGNFHSVRWRWLLLALLFPAVSFVMLIVVFFGFQGEQDLSARALIFGVFLSVANVAIIYLIGIMEKNAEEARENALLHQEMEIQTDSMIALEKSYRSQRQATHEYKNQLQTIYDLLEGGKTEPAKEYIRQLQGMQTTRIFTVNSHHPIIDAVLNHKYQTAKEKGIDVQMQVNDLSGITIGTDALVVLLSNLLDNAIEACGILPENRRIQCCILAEDGMFLSIRNTSAPVTITDNAVPTSKTPKEEHGFGLPRIQLILKQLQAEYTFSYENGWFEFAAEIPSP